MELVIFWKIEKQTQHVCNNYTLLLHFCLGAKFLFLLNFSIKIEFIWWVMADWIHFVHCITLHAPIRKSAYRRRLTFNKYFILNWLVVWYFRKLIQCNSYSHVKLEMQQMSLACSVFNHENMANKILPWMQTLIEELKMGCVIVRLCIYILKSGHSMARATVDWLSGLVELALHFMR